MTETFNTWTEYDAWLIQHYDEFAMTKLDEIDGKVVVEFMPKAEWEKQEKEAGRMSASDSIRANQKGYASDTLTSIRRKLSGISSSPG